MTSPVRLITAGRARARLVVFEGADEVARAAVEVLQQHLEERAGVRLPLYAAERIRRPTTRAHPAAILLGAWDQVRPFVSLVGPPPGPEGFALSAAETNGRGAVIFVAGADGRGVLYGVGRLLRSMTFGEGAATAQVVDACTSPSTPVRGHLLANHLWSPQYDNWDEACWDRYLADLSLWGVNTILTTPYHPGEWAACRPFDDPPVFGDEAVREAWERIWRVQLAVPRLARKYGMRFGLWIPPNDLPVDETRPKVEGGRCDNACPSEPDLRTLILRHRDRVFQALDPLDLVIVPSSDCGGCACPRCAPWVRTYLGLAEEIAASLHRHHPEAWMGLSTQNLAPEEEAWLFEHLRRERPPWLRFLVHGPGSADIAHLRREIPPEYDLFLYPDTTHLAAGGGYLFEDVRTDPLVWRVYQQAHLEATPFARPAAIAASYPRLREHAQGSFPYSEGAHDDLNKVLWSQLDWDPTADAAGIVREYCRFHFGAERAAELTEVWYALERALEIAPATNPEIERNLAAVEEAVEQLPRWAARGWRWKMLEVRGLLDRFLQLYQRMGTRVEAYLRACLASDRPDLALRDLADRVRDAGPRPVPDDLRLDLGAMFPYFPGAEAARRERQEHDIPEPRPHERELDSWTPDLRELERLDCRIQVLASELRESVGLELRAAWIIRRAKTPYDACLRRLEHVACSGADADLLRREMQRALEPEAAGDQYDDLGHPERQPHLVAGQRWEDAFGDLSLGTSPAEERRALSPWGEDLVLRYEGLRSDADHEVEVTYVQLRHETRRQRLVAVSPVGTHELHSALLLPTQPRRYAFRLPARFLAEGRVELRFSRVDGRPHNAVASEVRLRALTAAAARSPRCPRGS